MSGENPPRAARHSAGRASGRFQRRLLALLLLAAIGPIVAFGVVDVVMTGFFSLDLARLDETLERTEAALGDGTVGPELEAELNDTRLLLAQTQLARPVLFDRLRTIFIALLAGSIALVIVAFVMLRRSVSRPVEVLTQGMLRFGAGELAHRLPEAKTRRPDEIQLAVRQFNRMGDELVEQRRLLADAEKLAAWQDVARALAHELKNPLTAMKMALGRLARANARAASQAQRESLALLEEEVEVLLRMTQSFSSFAKLPDPVRKPLDLGALLGEVVALYREGAVVPVTLSPAGDRQVTIEGDADQLRRLFGNLVKNALEASRVGDAPVSVAIDEIGSPGRRALVTVADHGPGIPAARSGADLARSLGTTKAGGSGLGLPISYKIAVGHGGTLSLTPRPTPDHGTDAVVDLPLATRADDAPGV